MEREPPATIRLTPADDPCPILTRRARSAAAFASKIQGGVGIPSFVTVQASTGVRQKGHEMPASLDIIACLRILEMHAARGNEGRKKGNKNDQPGGRYP